jgi:hypothetical protein
MEASGSDTTEREALEGDADESSAGRVDGPGGARGGEPGVARADEPDTDERRTVWLDTGETDAVEEEPTERGWADDPATDERGATERDTTDEWRIEPARAPATVAELEERIDVALITAESAEEAAMEIGAASLEAAEQARRAAALAERASASAVRAASDASHAAESALQSREAAAATATAAASTPRAEAEPALNAPAAGDFLPRPRGADPRRPDPFEERITAFRQRAEKVMIRLQKLEAGADPGDGPSEVVHLR